MPLYLGCSMWALKTWVGSFFPAGSRSADFLQLYSRRLNTVEGNTTFYATPSPETVARWRDETPPGFKFCLKFPKAISHQQRLRNADAETADFVERLEQLGDRRGPAFLQLPPSFSADGLPALLAYLDGLPTSSMDIAVEVRHKDFFDGPAEQALDDGLRQRRVARVNYDVRGLFSASPLDKDTRAEQARKPNVPLRLTRTAPFAFVRFISNPQVDRNGPWMDEWAGQTADWLLAGDAVYFFVHNRNDFYSPQLAREFHAKLSARYALPAMPAWETDAGPAQPKLF